MRLRPKLISLVLPLVILLVLGLGWICYQWLADAAYAASTREMITAAAQLRLGLQATVQTAIANVELLSHSTLVQQYALTENERQRYTLLQPALLNLFANYQTVYPDYYEILFLLPNGYEDTRATLGDAPNATEEEGDTPYFQRLASHQDKVDVAFLLSPDTSEMVMRVAKPVWLSELDATLTSGPARLRGYLIITCRLETLRQQITSIKNASQLGVMLTDTQGSALLASADSPHGQEPVPEDLLARLRQSNAATPESAVVLNYRGEPTLLLLDTAADKLYLLISRPERDLAAIRRQLGGTVIGIALVSGLFAALLLLIALHYLLVRPIQQLRAAAGAIGDQNFAATPALSSPDELGDLARSLREMALNLERFHQQLTTLAYHDNLTGLPNRLMFKQYLERSLAHLARRPDHLLAVLFIDLDGFKQVNDTLGHEAGDQLLREVSQRLNQTIRPQDMAARLGGDEFAIELNDLSHTHHADQIAHRILSALAQTFSIEAHTVTISASIGVAIAPTDGTDAENLIHYADLAMYQAKQRGKNQYRYFNDLINPKSDRQSTQHSLSPSARLHWPIISSANTSTD